MPAPSVAGFPSPADDHVEASLDLSRELVGKEEETFFVRVAEDSMTGASVHDEDILVVDRSVEPEAGRLWSRLSTASSP